MSRHSMAMLTSVLCLQEIPPQHAKWTLLLSRTKTGPHRQHCLQLEDVSFPVTHVRMTMYPDGGVKRLRLIGRRAVTGVKPSSRIPRPQLTPDNLQVLGAITASGANSTVGSQSTSAPTIPALPLTAEAFAQYGYVVQSYPNPHHVPKGVKIQSVNQGSATKYNRLSPISALTPPNNSNVQQSANFSVYRCTPSQQLGGSTKAKFALNVLERHEYTTQAFLPLAGPDGPSRYLIIVALPSKTDGKPDWSTLRAFVATSTQGFSYRPNIWHHPAIALDKTLDFACITNETGNAKLDCEIIEYSQTVAFVEEATVSDVGHTSRQSKL